MTISGETFKSAISLKLSQTFPDIPIYKEKIPQGVQRPYFSIAQIDLDQTNQLSKKYNRLYQLQVCYYSTINDLQLFEHLDAKGNELLELFKTLDIELGETNSTYPVKSKLANYKMVDDTLQVFLNYLIRVYEKPSTDSAAKMATLKIDTSLKQ